MQVVPIETQAATNHVRSSTALTALIYLAIIAIAETLINFGSPIIGFIVYLGLMLGLFAHSASTWEKPPSKFLLTLSLIPLIRIVGLSLPLENINPIYWYLLISIPLFVAAAVMFVVLKLSWNEIGLTANGLPLQVLVGLSGLAFGFIGYQIIQPNALISNPTLSELIVSALILLICTGFLEELIFRGLVLHSAQEAIRTASIWYVAILYALLQMGQKSWQLGIFVFVVALFFSWIAVRTHSIIGVSIAHGLTNIVFFLVMPLVSLSTGIAMMAAALALSLIILLIWTIAVRLRRV